MDRLYLLYLRLREGRRWAVCRCCDTALGTAGRLTSCGFERREWRSVGAAGVGRRWVGVAPACPAEGSQKEVRRCPTYFTVEHVRGIKECRVASRERLSLVSGSCMSALLVLCHFTLVVPPRFGLTPVSGVWLGGLQTLQRGQTHVMCRFTPMRPDELQKSLWVSSKSMII